MGELTPEAARNRELWTQTNADYTHEQGRRAWAQDEISWGIWSVPEAGVGALAGIELDGALQIICRSVHVSRAPFGDTHHHARLGGLALPQDAVDQHLPLRHLLGAEVRHAQEVREHRIVRACGFERLEQRGLVRDGGAVRRLLGDTRMRDVVALGPEVVMPHFRTDAVADLTMAIGVAPRPISVADAPGLEPRIVILILAPREAATLYLQTVSTITRMARYVEPQTM